MKFQEIKDQMQQNKYTWLLTGCAGFIGSHLLEQLLNCHQTVLGIDNFSTGNLENIQAIENLVSPDLFVNFHFFEGDILDRELLDRIPNFDFVLHMAAQASVPHSLEDPMHTFQVNVVGTENIFELARLKGAKRVIYASSSAVYGDDQTEKKVETCIGNPLSPYANSKLINERQALQLSNVYGIPTTGLRYFNVFGSRQRPDGPYAAVIPSWMSCLQSGKAVTVNGKGDNTRDFIHVLDVVKMNFLAALGPQENTDARVLNVAGGEAISLLELYKNMARAWKSVYTDIQIQAPVHGPARAGDIKHSLGDVTRSKQLLNFSAEIDLLEGLKPMVELM